MVERRVISRDQVDAIGGFTLLEIGIALVVLALALWAAARFSEQPGWSYALWFTFAITYAALLRPDKF